MVHRSRPSAGVRGIHLQHDLGGKRWPLKRSSLLTPAAAAAPASRCATAHPPATAGARTDGVHAVPWAPPARNRSDGARVYLRRMTTPATPDVLEVLVENHRRFLAFLERRVGPRVEAEDILQDASVRSLDRADTERPPEAVSSRCAAEPAQPMGVLTAIAAAPTARGPDPRDPNVVPSRSRNARPPSRRRRP